MNYSETINYLYRTLPMFSRSGAKAIKPDLKNTEALCRFLGNPELKFPSVHVAGTNGKGSVSHMLAAIFQSHGFKTGLYTSPHLHDFRERIRINGKMIPKRAVIEFVSRSFQITRELKPSFFELTFAMAIDFFASQKVDIAVIETGLGGRLDSTNIIKPELSVITNIGLEHTDLLGDTLEKIAFEKAGIIKKNVPVVIGEYLPETRTVFEEKARKENAAIYFAADNYELSIAGIKKYLESFSRSSGKRCRYTLDLKGSYQQKNLAAVLQAVEVLHEKFSLKEHLVQNALSHVLQLTGLQGRWQVIHKKPLMVLDVAHNADGVRCLLQQVDETQYNKLHIVIGMVKDKDITAVLRLLPKSASYYFTNAQIPRALAAEDLKIFSEDFGLKGNTYNNVNNAILAALAVASPEDMILVCGSVFVVGEVNIKEIRAALKCK